MSKIIPGVGPDAPIVENQRGARQSASPYRLDPAISGPKPRNKLREQQLKLAVEKSVNRSGS